MLDMIMYLPYSPAVSMNTNYVYSQTLEVDASERREFGPLNNVGDTSRISIVRRREYQYLRVLWYQVQLLLDQNHVAEMKCVAHC